MFVNHELLRELCRDVIHFKHQQGHVVDGLRETVDAIGDSYDQLWDFAQGLRDLPLREDWPHVEPDGLEEIRAESDPARPTGPIVDSPDSEASARVEAGFLGSVCGCMLGKPIEINPTMAELRRAGEAVGAWPLRDYVPEAMLDALDRRHGSWQQSTRERIAFVAPDDDINYTILGMLLLEQHGLAFTQRHLSELWLAHLPITATFGPERTVLVKAACASLARNDDFDMRDWVELLNPRDEFCGALIRGDAYGYACPGRPELASGLAWRDASWTHRRTGIYGTMFVAAAMACAPVMREPLKIFRTALQYIPQRSRLAAIIRDSIDQVAAADDWLDGYHRIHQRYGEYGHCRVYQECGTLINTLRFAEDVGDGICKQVMQGCDTDSFGATAGSLLGLYFGPGHLHDRWLEPFHDDLHCSLAGFHERSLQTVARRIGVLPALVSDELANGPAGDRSAGPRLAVLDQ